MKRAVLIAPQMFGAVICLISAVMVLSASRGRCDELDQTQAATLRQKFRSRDLNRDGKVLQAEFVETAAEKDRPAAQRDFKLFDLDGDGELTFDEFRNIASLVPAPLRGKLPNPLTKLVDGQMAVIQKGWSNWDSDKDGKLDKTEFSKSDLPRSAYELKQATFEQWDRDGDGGISREDCRWLVEAGYGLRRVDGQWLHLPSGEIVYWWHFKNLDKNRDDRISREEFFKQG